MLPVHARIVRFHTRWRRLSSAMWSRAGKLPCKGMESKLSCGCPATPSHRDRKKIASELENVAQISSTTSATILSTPPHWERKKKTRGWKRATLSKPPFSPLEQQLHDARPSFGAAAEHGTAIAASTALDDDSGDDVRVPPMQGNPDQCRAKHRCVAGWCGRVRDANGDDEEHGWHGWYAVEASL